LENWRHGLESNRRELETIRGQVREKWGRLTDDYLDVINGRQDQLEGKIQERYGLAKDEAKKGCRGLVQDTAVDSGTLG
jgi:uncharacterized protein YjbJ (UPF0337 family)